jgi:hypothetical protein
LPLSLPRLLYVERRHPGLLTLAPLKFLLGCRARPFDQLWGLTVRVSHLRAQAAGGGLVRSGCRRPQNIEHERRN